MSRCIQYLLYLLLVLLTIGLCIVFAGIGTLPDTSQYTINPQTGFPYTTQEMKDHYRQSIVSSVAFKLIILGSIISIVSLSTIGVIYIIRKRCYSESIIFPELSPSVVDQQSIEPVPVSVAVSEPISPLMRHLPSTTHAPQSIVVPKHPVTWNELKLEHLQGHTTLV